MENKKQGRTYIARNIKKQRVMIDSSGNEIDPRTKQVINKPQK